MSFNLYTSNRLESLVEQLAAVVSRPLPSPMDQEIIVVQSLGMQQWISLELARRFGIWTNCWYPFPNTYLQEVYNLLIPELQTVMMEGIADPGAPQAKGGQRLVVLHPDFFILQV